MRVISSFLRHEPSTFDIMQAMKPTDLLAKNDTEAAQDIILEQQQIIAEKSSVIDHQKKRILILEEYLRLVKQNQFGHSSEKHPGQGEIFNEAELAACATEEEPEEKTEPTSETAAPQKKRGRKGFSSTIPREQVRVDLCDDEKEGAIDTFYVKTKEELDIIPAKVRVIEYMQEKAVFVDAQDERSIKVASMPKHPIGKVMASIGLLAYIIVSKYMDGLPLYRLEKILQRYGGNITRTSMASWIISLSVQCQPLIHLLRSHQHAGSVIQADETRIQVHKEPGYSNTGQKYMWVTLGGPPDQPSVLFEYDPSRGKEVALRLLEGYKGYVQADGYAGYDEACKQPGIIHLGCWDHARRKFVDAQKAQPKGKHQKVSKADTALGKIAKLYLIERKIKMLSNEEKYQLRQEKSIPILNDIREWLDANKNKVPKDSLTGKAFTYLDRQWPKLIIYCEHGQLSISNVLAENAIRPFVIGRKAWLFSDTPKGARASSIFYSLIETAKANEIEPHAYLQHIFKELPYADTVEKLEALLPWNVKDKVAKFKKQ